MSTRKDNFEACLAWPGITIQGAGHLIARAAVIPALLGAMMLPSVALSQAIPTGTDIVPDIALRGQGWSQAMNLREMGEFLLALVEVTVLTAALVFHPVNMRALRSRDHFKMMHQKFLFGLIGMTVGFLVMHHGYLIGFVIFGLGGLMRFRSEADESSDTTRLIVVSLVGLCVGLDLPVMALIATASAWIVIYMFGNRSRCYLTVRFEEKKFAPANVEALAQMLEEHGIAPLATSRPRLKPVVEFMLKPESCKPQVIDRIMAEYSAAKHSPVKDWHLE